jgi:hypothetical protein
MASINTNADNTIWQHHITQWQTSGLSQAAYCRQQALRPRQFRYWKDKFLFGSEPVEPKPQSGFARVQVAPSIATPPSPCLSLCFPGGIEVTGISQDNMALIKQLIEVLR